MMIKNILAFFILVTSLHATYAQDLSLMPGGQHYYKDWKTIGGVYHFGSKGTSIYGIEVSSLDSNTTFSYSINRIVNYTNFTYFPNSSLVQVSFSVHSSIPIDNLLYTIEYDKDSVPQWKKPDGKFVKQKEANGDYYTHIILAPVECKNTMFTVKLYNAINPEIVLKQIVSTVPIEKPILFANLNRYRKTDFADKKHKSVAFADEYKKLDNARLSTLEMQDIAGGNFYLNTDNSPYVYRVLVIRNRKGVTDTMPVYYVWGESKTHTKELLLSKFKRQASFKNIYSASIPADLIRKAGTYELLVFPTFMNPSNPQTLYAGKSASIKFEVYQSNLIDASYVLLFALLFLLTVLLFFIWYKRRQKRRLKQQQQQTREAKLKLEAVRSQLNPHFIFNALAGIQNLMNKHETDKSLDYLSTFSRVTRSVLNNAAKELITIDEEIKWLTDYLEMEQLRFNFQYEILLDKNLDKHNIEIPAMLLQPFIENAIKHGIPHLKENGHITISFDRLNHDMQVTITDNGKGFDTSKEYDGAGLPLSRSRIDLLNTIYKNNRFQLTIDSTNTGTKVIITLKNWL